MTILTTVAIKNAKPTEKPYLLYDSKEKGLHVHVAVSGRKTFRLKAIINGKAKVIKIGDFKYVGLDEAREKAYDMNKQISNGLDPTAELAEPVKPEIKTFKQVAELFVIWKRDEHGRAESTIRKYNECLNNDLIPEIGAMDIKAVDTVTAVSVIQKINKRSNSLAIKNLEMLKMVITHAIHFGLRDSYTNLDLKGLISEKEPEPKIMPSDLKNLFEKIDVYPTFIMRCAITLQFHFYLRGAEIMGGLWDEIDFDKKLWTVPKERMKMKRIHIVPLSSQSIDLLQKLKAVTGDSPYLFPSSKTDGHISRDALSKAFRAAELEIVPHGCRTLAATWQRNAGYAPHVVETQLSHCESNQIAAAYQTKPHLLYLSERVAMMQAYSDYLFSFKT